MATFAPTVESHRRSYLPVLLCGLCSATLTLAAVWYVGARWEEANVMGWYADYVIPVGAFLVGLTAGSGYGVGSWRSGVKIGGGLLLAVVAMQVLVYFVAQYLEYAQLKALMAKLQLQAGSFFAYFDYTTRSFAWKQDSGEAGHALGLWGYGVRFLEVAGFVFGGLIAPLALKGKPYCDGCQVYMKTRDLGLLPAGVPMRKIKKKDEAGQREYEAAHQAALAAGDELVAQLRELTEHARSHELKALLEQHKAHQKEYATLTARVRVRLHRCPVCRKSELALALCTGAGEAVNETSLGTTAAHPTLWEALV